MALAQCDWCEGAGFERVADAAGDMDEISCRKCDGQRLIYVENLRPRPATRSPESKAIQKESTKGNMSLRDLALSLANKREPVLVPELGTVYVRPLTIGEAVESSDDAASAVVKFTLDGNGERVFQDSDVETVRQLPAYVVGPIVKAINAVNHIGEDEKKG